MPWGLRSRTFASCLSVLLLACALSCDRKHADDPHIAYDHADQALLHGDLKQAQDEAHRECLRLQGPDNHSDLEWIWKLRILEARAMLQQGLYTDALKLLQSQPPPSGQPDLAIRICTLEAEANLEPRNLSVAQALLDQATKLCSNSESANCGYVLRARGLLADERNQPQSAERLYEMSLAFARSHGNALLESSALLNLGNAALSQGRFDEAMDRSEAGYQAAKAVGARRLEVITQGNIGWAYYNLGDSEKALRLSETATDLAAQLGDVWNQENYLTNIGYIYMDERKFDLAAHSFQQALSLSRKIHAQKHIYNVLRVLARLSLQTGDLSNATQYAQQALEIAREDKDHHLDELYPNLVLGQIAARHGDAAAAEATFHAVERDKDCPVFLKWEAEHSLAQLYQDSNRPDFADREYRAALATFETARDQVRHEDSQLSFLTNASRIYDDYVHFLVARGKTGEALRWADYNRARTLAEGLGLLSKEKQASLSPPPLDPQQIARHAQATVLFYWLGEKQSYLWAITAQKVTLFALPPAAEIDASVARYRQALAEQDVLDSANFGSSNRDGLWLYRTLIGPAQSSLQKDAKIFLIPDGSLNNLNFETLLVPPGNSQPNASDPSLPTTKLHYWIEDATIANASSLRVLGAAHGGKHELDRSLLLVGNSVAPNQEYPELPKAAAQMISVARQFPETGQRVLAREHANPAEYLASNPEKFSYIHFVAHGTASRVSPLDSAIVLSKNAAQPDSFKLYARDIIRHPLQANLVTISACSSAGERSYSGEGLVGLAWAFLRAGAHNVIAASWEVTDASTEQLMDKFYEELSRGATPDTALREAKLSLLRSASAFSKPFYWAPFQLYVGS